MQPPRTFAIEPLANEPLRGILLIIAAFVTFSMLDTTASVFFTSMSKRAVSPLSQTQYRFAERIPSFVEPLAS